MQIKNFKAKERFNMAKMRDLFRPVSALGGCSRAWWLTRSQLGRLKFTFEV